MSPPKRLATVPNTAYLTHFFGWASTMGTSSAKGGMGKTEPSITDTSSMAATACCVEDSASTRM